MLLANTNSPKRSIIVLHKRVSAESQSPPIPISSIYNRPFSPPHMLPSLGTPPLAPNKGIRANSQTPKMNTAQQKLTPNQKSNLTTLADSFKSITSPSAKKLSPLSPDNRKPPSSGALIGPILETSDALNFTTISSLGERDTS